MRIPIRHILATLLLGVSTAVIAAPPKGWEQVKPETAASRPVVKDTEFEVRTVSGAILVTANHQVQIKIFTILGRLVNSDTLPAGTSKLTLPAHGVYIVKIGDITCKVAV